MLCLCSKINSKHEFMFFFYFLLLVFGLIAGSFAGMLTYRLPRRLSLRGWSYCDHCRNKLAWSHNIPLFSFLYLAGRCAYCKGEISARYPLIEVATAILFVVTGYLWGVLNQGLPGVLKEEIGLLSLVFLLVIVFLFLALCVVDLEYQLLPDFLVLILGVLVFLVLLSLPSPSLVNYFLWGFVAFSFFLLIYLVTRGRGMGFGDVKLAFVVGMLLGYPTTIVWIFLAFLVGALVGVVLILSKRAKWGAQIAFGPFMLVAAYVALFFGEELWRLYTGGL